MGSQGASWRGAAYDRTLESFSKPLMRRYERQYRFVALQTYPDGVTSDFHFAAEQGAQNAWRYPDLTTHVRYFSALLRDTVDHEMACEASALPALRPHHRVPAQQWLGRDRQTASRSARHLCA
ncbi:hypothetical protein ACN9MJ_12665 [Acidovorax facilis]|uniref:hypothetical protein n=1 Tax=Acidovorax facilis TaxID=12917 RepID=UPI003CF0E702